MTKMQFSFHKSNKYGFIVMTYKDCNFYTELGYFVLGYRELPNQHQNSYSGLDWEADNLK